ncbi:helix-turn-helix domain-containing protein, partial [Candidatus Sumerlaeota bacterium]|nr:helix-turn-helix domain-containing protein [Candidatus Sumerlaeota bacterium]
TLAEVEKRAIIRALRYADGNRNRAAELLAIHRNTLRKKMQEYDIKM